MPTQYQIEQAAGITDPAIAKHMMTQETQAAKNAMSLLQMQCSCYDPGGFALLQQAVSDCRREMGHNASFSGGPSGPSAASDSCTSSGHTESKW